ncbi:MAG: DNA alkylation repair protein [Candidatus Microthrix subdominans]|nr:DNA alkylation repair protein [Candidatus Microthrix sp.]MBK6309544.1 DNA alkylation repair protein [Candidatus Microthrix sp.]MBK9559223.1 DNA alkylation repair protein [Candidatus Microthrix sp.]
MESTSELDMAALRRRLEAASAPDRAELMSAYLRNQFPFLGIGAKDRRAATRPTLVAAKTASTDELIAFAAACWEEPEREFAYVACDVLRTQAPRLEPRHLDAVRSLLTARSWWDTIDPLATRTVGTMVRTNPELVGTMDRWVHSDDFWLARTAILHQLLFGEATDAQRLLSYCEARAGDDEFFIRKAIGWALRQYARVDPAAVRTFVVAHDGELSGLTKREALKHLN